jgi:uncharacterized BrkB/YihY/UPF0761 family membrane protein
MSFIDQIYYLLNSPAQLVQLAGGIMVILLFGFTANNSIKRFKNVGDAYNRIQQEELLKQALMSLIPTIFSLVLLIIGLTVLV